MATRTVSLDEEAYQRLKDKKKDGESFSDVVKKLAGERSWTEVSGSLSAEEDDTLEKHIKSGRKESRRRQDSSIKTESNRVD